MHKLLLTSKRAESMQARNLADTVIEADWHNGESIRCQVLARNRQVAVNLREAETMFDTRLADHLA